MTYSPNKSLLSKAKIVWKTLVVLVLSVLLFAPTPALAFDYSGTLQSYVSSAKVEIDGVVTSIKKLPGLSYENGQTTLAEVDSKLQKIQTNAHKNAKDFQNLSDEAQKEYERLLNPPNNIFDKKYRTGHFTLFANQTTNLPSLTNTTNLILYFDFSAEGKWGWSTDPKDSSDANGNVSEPNCPGCRFPNLRRGTLVMMKNNKVDSSGSKKYLIKFNPGETVTFMSNDGIYDDNVGSQTITYYFYFTPKQAFLLKNGNKVTVKNLEDLETEKQKLAKGIVLTNKISKLCDDLEKRVNLAKQKSGNVKEYADALKSFSDPDILSEIADLNTFVANLTNNLTIAI